MLVRKYYLAAPNKLNKSNHYVKIILGGGGGGEIRSVIRLPLFKRESSYFGHCNSFFFSNFNIKSKKYYNVQNVKSLFNERKPNYRHILLPPVGGGGCRRGNYYCYCPRIPVKYIRKLFFVIPVK